MTVIDSLAPVFLVIALGAILCLTGFVSIRFLHGTNRLAYWIGMPCLLFHETATAAYQGAAAGRALLIVLGGMLVTLAAGYVVAWACDLPQRQWGTFVQAAFRGNLAFIGLPIILYGSSSTEGLEMDPIRPLAVLILALVVPVYNLSAVVVLLASRHAIDKTAFRTLLVQLASNPLLLSCVAGILYAWLGPPLPVALGRTLHALGTMALPLALLGIGGSMVTAPVRGHLGIAALAGLLKVALAPLAGLGIVSILGATLEETRLALIFLACPTATASYVMAHQLGGDEGLAAGSVVVSSAISIVSLAAVLALT